MNKVEKLRLSADLENGYCFKQGLFVRLYEESLYWFVTHIKPLKPMLERVKNGEPIVYGGLPVASFEKLLEGHNLHASATENGWQWRYAEQTQGNSENFNGYAAWRETVLATEQTAKQLTAISSANGRNILHEIRAFNLAASTPIQTMSAVADWQEFLRNWEGAG